MVNLCVEVRYVLSDLKTTIRTPTCGHFLSFHKTFLFAQSKVTGELFWNVTDYCRTSLDAPIFFKSYI